MIRFFLSLTFSLILCIVGFFTFYPILNSNSIIIDYGIKQFDLCIDFPNLWNNLKILFIVTYLYSSIYISKLIFSIIFPKKKKNMKSNVKLINIQTIKDYNSLYLSIGKNSKGEIIRIPESGLFQNILITGTIGTRENK